MASLLDLFAIGFSSEGLANFEQNLKNSQKELDTYEQKVKDLEGALKDLEKQGEKDSDVYKSIQSDLEQAQRSAAKFRKEVETMQGSNQAQLSKMKASWGNLVKTLGLIATVGITVKKSLEFYEQAEQLDFLAQKAGIATDKLQALGGAASRYGGTTEGSAGTIENLRSKGYKDPEAALENIARKMETLKSDTAKWNLANSLGIDEGTTRLLMQGVTKYREELKRADKYKLYTKEDIERMRDYRQIQNDIRMGTASIFGVISRWLLPALTALGKNIRSITDFFAEHEGVAKIIAVFIAITAAVGGAIGVVKLLNIALAFLAANPVVLTIVAITAAITALIVIIQDFIVWLNGGESALSGLWNTGAKVFDALKQKGSEFISFIKGLWESLPTPFRNLFGGGNNISATMNSVSKGQQVLTAANNNPMNSVPTGATSNYYQTMARNQNSTTNATNISNSRNSNKNVNISQLTIQTQASDPKGVANTLYGSILSEFDDGIAI